MRRSLPLLLTLAVGCGPTAAPPPTGYSDPAEPSVSLTPVSVADLEKAVASHKGKVVLVDAWFLG